VREQFVGEDDLDPDPIRQFDLWYREALAAGEPEPDAMAVATVGGDVPAVRFVLLKGHGDRGFVFYTNWNSRKGREIAANHNVALAFRWGVLERQVRVIGTASLLSADESDAYFRTRPRPAQLGAWASDQSEPIGSRADLDEHLEVVTARFAGREVPRPPWWGGYVVAPFEMEFWVSHRDRLHDRFQYRLKDEGWVLRRLNP
jgi:pyridoxamine 5'-phosphate oxidase